MSFLRISCPHCGFSREMPEDRLPSRPVEATCPRCASQFTFDRSMAAAVDAPDLPTPLPQPVQAPQHDSGDFTAGASHPPLPAPLQPVGALFAATWNLYKRRWLLLVGIMLATAVTCTLPPLVVSLFSGVAKGSFAGTVALIMTFCGALLCSLVVICWGMAAGVIAVVDERTGFRDAVERAREYWIPLAWVSGLYSFIAGGASILLLLPGILAAIWFFGCAYLTVTENSRGMDALLTSKALVGGRFWPVTGRLALVWLLGTVLGLLPVIGVFLSLLTAPFSMLYTWLLFQELRATAAPVSCAYSDGAKAGWLILGLVGWLALPFMVFALAGAAFFTALMPLFKLLMEQQGTTQQILTGNWISHCLGLLPL